MVIFSDGIIQWMTHAMQLHFYSHQMVLQTINSYGPYVTFVIKEGNIKQDISNYLFHTFYYVFME